MNTTTNAPITGPFVISHVFNAPIERVWRAWAECEELRQWFGPAGVNITTATLDFRPGGSFHYCMRTPDGRDMWGKFAYREITEPLKMVWTHSFSDESGGITRHPFSANWPLEMLSSATLADADGKTRLTIEWQPLKATEAEQQTFDSAHDGMRQGWSGTFGRLTGHLAKA